MVKTNFAKNRTKIAAFVITLLMVLYVAPLCLASGDAEKGSDAGKIELPGVPDNAVQYDKSDVTPVAEMEQVKAGEPAFFQYKNMTMLMNCTRNCDLVVTVDPAVKPQLFGLSIDPNQTMTLTMNLSGTPLEGAQTMQQSLNCYFGIEPNAAIQLSAQLKLHVNQTELSQHLNREVNASRLTWMYWNRTRSEWETVESHMDQNGYLICNTNHFSTWTVAEISESTETGGDPETTNTGIPMEYILAGVAVVVIIALGVGIYANSKRGK
jgi:hypothetical protein